MTQKLIPIGISNFEKMITGNYLYVDKTSYIEQLENTGHQTLMFLRPRRFGKSLFLSMLRNYYDIKTKGQFDKLFGGLYIGKNPTPLKNSYVVLALGFSGIDTSNTARFKDSFEGPIIQAFKGMFRYYEEHLPDAANIIKDIDNAGNNLKNVMRISFDELQRRNLKLCVLIDEYDHFANDLIAMDDGVTYKDVVHAIGFVRDFYEMLKEGTMTVVDRIFMTGVSPVMLDDMTSGFNIAVNITLHEGFNSMLGFTEDEVGYILDSCSFTEGYAREELKKMLKLNYNGYQFNKKARGKIYNSNMLLNFLGTWQSTKSYPENILDPNINMDRARIMMLAKNENNRKTLEDILLNEKIIGKVEPKFSFEFMYRDEYFVSLLFYMGMLTVDVDGYGTECLAIPNYVSKVTYWDYMKLKLTSENNIRIKIQELMTAIADMAIKGDMSSFIKYISEGVLSKIFNRDLGRFDEKYIKLLLMAYVIQTDVYRAVSERECEEGYIDLLFERHEGYRHFKHDWMIEIKYLKEGERDKAQETLQKAKKQLERYALDSEYKGQGSFRYNAGNIVEAVKGEGRLKLAAVVFIGKKDYVMEEL